MRNPKHRSPETLLQHIGEEEKILGAVVPPIFQNSLFVFDDLETFRGQPTQEAWPPPYFYSRIANPSMDVAERKIAFLERTERAKVFGSGMGAISCAIMSCVASGSHVVAIDTCYSNTRTMLSDYLPRFGVDTTFVDGRCPSDVLDALRPETSLIYLESPSTFFFYLQDIEAITKVAREKKIKTILDNSYATPLFQTPAEMGVDLVVHSATKYLGGHSDIVAGVLCGNDQDLFSIYKNEMVIFGSGLSPFPAWLLTRGLRTLPLRIKQHEAAGNAVASWLEKSPHVARVYHVGLKTYPQRELFKKQMRGSTGLLSFEPAFQTEEAVTRFVNGLDVFQLGVSWGGFESLVVPAQKPGPDGSPKWVIRLYCGLEDPRDMVADLEQAFALAG